MNFKDVKNCFNEKTFSEKEFFNQRHKIRAYMLSFVLAIWTKKSLDFDSFICNQFSILYEILRYLIRPEGTGSEMIVGMKAKVMDLYRDEDPSLKAIIDCCFLEFKPLIIDKKKTETIQCLSEEKVQSPIHI